MHPIRIAIEQRERAALSPLATLAEGSDLRVDAIEPDSVRTCFQRDRDRVLHSKAFRRLKYKTQVFIAPGDHYRTRLTHTLEVSQIARTIGRALRLNEDLIEAIALAHDVGHTPFGHIGEEALDAALKERGGEPGHFRHYEQSLRIVDDLEKLNLTRAVRDGISGHSKGQKDLTDQDGQPVSTLEAAVVRIADRIAYVNHDLDDALRSEIILAIPSRFESLGDTHGHRIASMVEDVIENSLDQPSIRLSRGMMEIVNELKDWLFQNVYFEYPVRFPDIAKARLLLVDLFNHYCEPGNLPEGFSGIQGAVDYVAGMTDRYAIETYARLRLPEGFRGV